MKITIFAECGRPECWKKWEGARSEKPEMVMIEAHNGSPNDVAGKYECKLCGNIVRIDLYMDRIQEGDT